jgi:hypothetical protein
MVYYSLVTMKHRTFPIPLVALSLTSLACEAPPPPPGEIDAIVGAWSITTAAVAPNPSTILDVDINLDGSNLCDIVYQIDEMLINEDLTGVLNGSLTFERCSPEATMSGTVVRYTDLVSVNVLINNAQYEISLGANSQTPALLQLELSGDVLSGADDANAAWSFLRVE